ncbi:subtilisin-like serine protease pr1c [Colletotrichum truncatum]|uniref:Subtilisin-like serine protease pr1c n=1 Tax=Colletotrichum truncatum TaxID=5467 RepID=A0ACC3YHI2_COLTU
MSRFRKRDGSMDTVRVMSSFSETVGATAQPVLTFDSAIFRGMSFELPETNATSVKKVENITGVQAVWPAGIFTIPETQAIVQEGENPPWTPHVMTRVNELHARGINGSDVVVALVDSGVDYNHPDLGGGFGPGFKVEGGYDLVGDAYNGKDVAAQPDADPMDCQGHGTHVSGIVASTNRYNPGVAPDARLRMYKVFGCSTSTSEDYIIAAFLRAHDEGADIISASLGSVQGFPYTPTSIVASKIQAAGTFIAAAAGNSGQNGPFYSSNLGNAFGITTVGSVAATDLVGHSVVAHASDGSSREIKYVSASQSQFKINGTVKAHFYNDTTRDSCDWSTAPKVPDDEILLLPRGDCNWWTMDIILFGKVKCFAVALISREDGLWLLNKHKSGVSVTYEFVSNEKPIAVPVDFYGGGAISNFSSWGPTLDARMKPEISAPGGGILSTYPMALGKYAVLSGTSMATPYVAGVAALYFSSRGGRATLGSDGARLAHERIIASGSPVGGYQNNGVKENVAMAGAGLLDAVKVVDYQTSVSPANINLNDTDHFQSTHVIRISNSGDKEVEYRIFHEPGSTMHPKRQNNAWTNLEPPEVMDKNFQASVSLSAETIKVGPRSTSELTIQFTEPVGSNATLPVYGGGIVIASDKESLRVTYMGIKGSLYWCDIWEMHRGTPLFMRNYDGVGQLADGDHYVLQPYGTVPLGYFNVLWSTEEISFDYVARDWTPSDWVYPPVPGQNKWYGSAASAESNFPVYKYPRIESGQYAVPGQTYSHGGPVLPGEYRMLGRTLRTYGDPSRLDDWQWKLSPWFTMKAAEPSNSSTTSVSITTSAEPTTSAVPPPLATCGGDVRPISIQARGNGPTLYKVAIDNDFLCIDTDGTSVNPSEAAINDEGQVAFRFPGVDNDRWASAHTIANSLIYLYRASSINSPWSYLTCNIAEGSGKLECKSNARETFYACGGNSPLVRVSTQVPTDEGCYEVTFFASVLDNPACSTSTAITTSSAVSTTKVTSTSGPSITASSISFGSNTAVPS